METCLQPLDSNNQRGPLQIIVFSFSKKECEALAMQMVSMDLNSSDEKKIIESVFNRYGA